MDTNTKPTPLDASQPSVADDEALYTCIGVCMIDTVSGLCQGCGRPLGEPQPLDDSFAG